MPIVNLQKTQFKGVLMLLTTALIFGVSFVAQSVGMERVECFTFNAVRMLLGALVLLPFVLISDRKHKKVQTAEEWKRKNKSTWLCGLILGVVFCIASNFQQFAFNYSNTGKIAFITALYLFFVPLFGLFFKKKVPLITWLCVIIGFVGLYFLCIDPSSFSINLGDALAALCAVFFAAHILLVEKFRLGDCLKLSFIQILVTGVISAILAFIFEKPQLSAILSVYAPILYSAILTCGVAYTLQIIGQRYTEATVASLIMCMESVFAVLAAAIILHEYLSLREIIGCIIMFIAILSSQASEIIAEKIRKKSDN